MRKILLFLFILLIPAMAQRSVIRTLSNHQIETAQNYGELFFADSAVTLTISADTYAAIVNGDSSLYGYTGGDTLYNATYLKDALIMTNAGFYVALFDLTFKSADTDTAFICLGVNSTADENHEVGVKVDSLVHEHASGFGLYSLAAGDTVRAFAKTVGGEDLTAIGGNVIIFRIRRP